MLIHVPGAHDAVERESRGKCWPWVLQIEFMWSGLHDRCFTLLAISPVPHRSFSFDFCLEAGACILVALKRSI